jgi:hypothetical protein
MPPTKATLPVMASPVATLRGDINQASFAHRLGLSRQALLRLEQGLPVNPSLKLKKYLPSDDAWAEFVDDYYAYQTSKREANFGLLTTEPNFWTGEAKHDLTLKHPFREWMEQSNGSPNLSQVCVAFCLHLPVMYRFVNGPYPLTPPDLLLTALTEAGYEKELITEFMLFYADWRPNPWT